MFVDNQSEKILKVHRIILLAELFFIVTPVWALFVLGSKSDLMYLRMFGEYIYIYMIVWIGTVISISSLTLYLVIQIASKHIKIEDMLFYLASTGVVIIAFCFFIQFIEAVPSSVFDDLQQNLSFYLLGILLVVPLIHSKYASTLNKKLNTSKS